MLIGDVTGWQDCVMKEVERKHEEERNLFVDMLQEKESQDLKEEANSMSTDERNQRLNKLKAKRVELDFDLKCRFPLDILSAQPLFIQRDLQTFCNIE